MKKYLDDDSVTKPLPSSRVDLLELCAIVAWPRRYLAKKEDQEAWSTRIPDVLLTKMRSLYPAPPRRANSIYCDSDSIYARVAEAVTFFCPDVLLIDSSAAGAPSP